MDRLPQQVLYTVLEKVFLLLPQKDRKAAVMVNRAWRQIGEAPHLWSWVVLPEVDEDNIEMVSEMLATRRLEKVENLTVVKASDKLLLGVAQHIGLKRLVFERRPDNQEMLRYSQDFDDLLTAVSSGDSSLEILSLSGLYLYHLPPTLFASAIARLVEVDLSHSRLFEHQIAAIMEAINKGDISLKRLCLSNARNAMKGEALHDLKPLVKLQSVDLSENIFLRQQLVNFFAALSPDSNLRELRIAGSRIKDRGHQLLSQGMEENIQLIAEAVNFLEKVTMDANPSQVITHKLIFVVLLSFLLVLEFSFPLVSVDK